MEGVEVEEGDGLVLGLGILILTQQPSEAAKRCEALLGNLEPSQLGPSR